MAETTPSAGGEPTVTLTADASPFEAVLDKAADKVSGWGSRIESRMGALAENIRGRTAKIADALASVNEKVDAGADIAGSIGSVIGGAAGAWAGPVGILIGKQLGEGLSRTLADSIDFGDALSGANSLKAGIDAQVEDAKDSFAGLKFSIGKRFEEIRGIIGELNLSDIIAGDADNAEKKFDELAGRVGEKVEEMIGQSMARIGDFIDRAFERVKEPLATVVEAIQAVAQHFGLAEQGAESWGDSIRSIQGIGEKVFTALAKGLGYVTTALEKAGAYATKYLAEPWLKSVRLIMTGLTELSKAMGRLPGQAGRAGKEMATALERSGAALDRTINAAGKWADGAINKGWGERSDDWAKRVAGMMARGREMNAVDDAGRKMEAKAEEAMNPAGSGERGRGVSAMLGGSAAANNAIIAATRATRDAADNPAKEAAKGIKNLNAKTAALVDKTDDVMKKLDRVAEGVESLGAA